MTDFTTVAYVSDVSNDENAVNSEENNDFSSDDNWGTTLKKNKTPKRNRLSIRQQSAGNINFY